MLNKDRWTRAASDTLIVLLFSLFHLFMLHGSMFHKTKIVEIKLKLRKKVTICILFFLSVKEKAQNLFLKVETVGFV